MNIQKQIKAIRTLSGISQKELAKISKATQAQICRIEGGQDCTLKTAQNILRALGYDLAVIAMEREEGGQNAD